MRPQTKKIVLGIIGALTLILVSEVVGRLGLAGKAWPAPIDAVWSVLGSKLSSSLLFRALGATLASAGTGLLIGSFVGTAVGFLGFLLPPLRAGLDQTASILNTIPLVALAPLLIALVGPQGMSVLTAALGSGFAMFVATASGLVAVSATHSDLFRVSGASRLQHIIRLSLPSAVPSLLGGLTLAGSGAVLGAVLGEWFGAPTGLGVLMISSMQNFQVKLLFVVALTAALVSLIAFYAMVAIQKMVGKRFV
ncbi:ABC transporter permease [Arthrobacter bambusae]|uniref:ABC transporter permease n=1 Tax=Arthrobacter sp. efr-133-R2A-120 TaxID=3040277 RepID=UPI0025503787|nr:ABC transporter permease subunit [Arthrobacter sp. efr-133-R2A-120]